MNYQHAFHAGNFADVHKHAVLARVLVLSESQAGGVPGDRTHAGAGRYDLHSAEATRGGEWQDGIVRLLGADHWAGMKCGTSARALSRRRHKPSIPAAGCESIQARRSWRLP